MIEALTATRAKEIRQLHEEIAGAFRLSVEKAIRVGELLTEQKNELLHGEFLPWLAENCPFDTRTVQRYMRLYERRDELKYDSLTYLTAAYKMLEAPRATWDEVTPPSLPEGKYRVIYADPPWRYEDRGYLGLTVEAHYPTMTTENICGLPVQELAHEDCTLFLWATSPRLPDGLRVLTSWGFEYKAMLIWDKVKHVPGHYTSVRHELVLIGTRGSGVPTCDPTTIANTDSVLVIPRNGEHSQKPQEMRELIERLYPGTKRIELFARGTMPDWARWGYEVPAGVGA